MVTYIQKNNHFVTFIVTDNPNVHVNTAFKKIGGPLKAFGTQWWMGRISARRISFFFNCFFSCSVSFLKFFWKRAVKVGDARNPLRYFLVNADCVCVQMPSICLQFIKEDIDTVKDPLLARCNFCFYVADLLFEFFRQSEFGNNFFGDCNLWFLT